MTSFKDALVLLTDIAELSKTQEFPEAERLIQQARNALREDLRSQRDSRRNDKKGVKPNLVSNQVATSDQIQQRKQNML